MGIAVRCTGSMLARSPSICYGLLAFAATMWTHLLPSQAACCTPLFVASNSAVACIYLRNVYTLQLAASLPHAHLLLVEVSSTELRYVAQNK